MSLFSSKVDSFCDTQTSYDGLKANRLREIDSLSSRVSDPVLKTILKTTENLLRTVTFFDAEIEKISQLAIDVTKALNYLDVVDFKIIEMRYFRVRPVGWDIVGRNLGYDMDWIQKRHGRILIELSEII